MDKTTKVKEGWFVVTTHNAEQAVGYIRQTKYNDLEIQFIDAKKPVTVSLVNIFRLTEISAEKVKEYYKNGKPLSEITDNKAIKDAKKGRDIHIAAIENAIIVEDI